MQESEILKILFGDGVHIWTREKFIITEMEKVKTDIISKI